MSGLAVVIDARGIGSCEGPDAAMLWRISAAAAHHAVFGCVSTAAQLRVLGLLPQVNVLSRGADEAGWWKIDAVLDFAVALGVRRVVWLDAELASFDPRLGVTRAEAAEDALADAGVAALLVAPDASTGLAHVDADAVERFAARPDGLLPPREQPERVQRVRSLPAVTYARYRELSWPTPLRAPV
ncbi:hypothetical protein SPF06_21900 [Sinomonas sp. JGH33]|uniref:Uncharacterized protein n=1 Tax=Sinomonas terricola TaxID=3110330 RepID=A0ABU5TCH9_9MICC|nr:hypothetical protein [Sinomonas sp. JGH33]MEA5457378.1 hypothetical protein [Sinomonas sp. JGH33]